MAGKIENPTLAGKFGKIARSAPGGARGRQGTAREAPEPQLRGAVSLPVEVGSARLGLALAVAALALAVAVAAVAVAVHASPKVDVSRR